MDPLSAAGIGLGAVSLTMQLFAGCIKGVLDPQHHHLRAIITVICI